MTLKKEHLKIGSCVISTKHTTSQFPGRGPLMWMMPLHLHINQKSDSDDDVQVLLSLIWVQIVFKGYHEKTLAGKA